MLELMMILTGVAIGLIVGLMSKQEPEQKPWKPKKKNFFVRLGESGDPVHFPK